jgi:hypothetical protein
MVKVTDYFDVEEEKYEEVVGSEVYTGYPKPTRRWKLLYEKSNNSVEESYFWIKQFLQHGPVASFSEFIKVIDLFSASEQSAFFGSAQSRLGLQQDKVSQFMGTIGKMVKELFQLVRELRIIDERLELYNNSSEGDQASEIALKGYWIDLVEGGSKNPASVYGMARELQFGTLPDLFFGARIMKSDEVQKEVESLDFNKKVKEVLMRKLKTFIVWKKHTHKELNNRRNFTIKYLRQHWDAIHMYMNWVKPYLLNIKRMQLNQKDIERNADLVSAFEGSIVEIEFLAKRKTKNSDYNSVALIKFWFRTTPKMDYHQQEYQNKGPIHVGKLIIDFRSYAWTDQDIENYLNMREQESFELLGDIDSSVKAAMESLGDELKEYLIEAGEKNLLPPDKDKTKKAGKKKVRGPFLSVLGGFGELFGSLLNISPGKGEKNKGKEKKKPIKTQYQLSQEMQEAEVSASKSVWTVYKNFKKAHKMAAW